MSRALKTQNGVIGFPTFLPVTTFGGHFPLDEIVRPYLKRYAQAIMVSHFYAEKITPQGLPVFIDSGGFASLFKESQIIALEENTYGIQSRDGTLITPKSVLEFQEKHADIAATLDFIISPETSLEEGMMLQDQTIANAKWAIKNKRQHKIKLFASIQAWDRPSMQHILEALLPFPFDGFALGGMVPRIRKASTIFDLVTVFREMESVRPLHLFGVGAPKLVKSLFNSGVSSVDSSNYVQQAASKRYLLPSTGQYVQMDNNLEPKEVCSCKICQQFTKEYLVLEGELNNMALALHNLAATFNYLKGKHNE